MVGFRFDTIGFNNAISLGTRDLIADRIENVMGGHQYDANVTIARDKNIAGRIMAIGRINRPSILVYGGTKKGLVVACTQPIQWLMQLRRWECHFLTGRTTSPTRIRMRISRTSARRIWTPISPTIRSFREKVLPTSTTLAATSSTG
ncbi:dihydroxy-acid dehydratase, mitochondrial-like isoform X2 [Tasmannia lanceolata]|uniref:dihydroxy-acid dehydratase, mitochondrial-like isoform X2 n=1 Tax=Tasmannia lanceolata TaxID=3420 RepID=UPI004062F181